jgi:hypothetical protein
MAKKWQKRIEEETSEFKTPEFDEREYLEKELRETRILAVTVVYAILIAVLSLAVMIFAGRDATFGFLIGIMAIISLRYVYPATKINISLFDAKKWVMSALTFFGIWLAVWILLCNPPVSDFTPPSINKVSVSGVKGDISGGSVVTVSLQGGSNVSINATVTDNFSLDRSSISFSISATGQPALHPAGTVNGNAYRWTVSGVSPGQYSVTITAKDTWRNEKVMSFSLYIEA